MNEWIDFTEILKHFGMQVKQNQEKSQSLRRFNGENEDIVDAEFEEVKDEKQSNTDSQKA